MNIVVAGGGTAGWISAFIIDEAQPGVHNITVVESSAIGIIGAGEGSTGSLYDLVSGSYFGRENYQNVIDFMDYTDSTYKFGIHHVDWSSKREGGYFAPLDSSPRTAYAPDVIFNHVLATYGTEKAHLASYLGQSYESNKLPDARSFGFHFNAHKVGMYFKEKLEKRKNVKVIDSKINDVVLNSKGEIDHLLLEQDVKVLGEFFIDCTGFSRVLLSKLEVQWHSYSKNLIANKAMPFIVDYTEKTRKAAKPYTTAHALSSGWMWDIPLKTRRGCGYVYNSNFLSEEDAQKEIETTLGHPIEPIRHLSFDAGRSEKLWYKNCLASGLSAAFMEPLEATSIHSTISQMMVFAMDYLLSEKNLTVQDSHSDSYNNKFKILYDSYRDFLVLHYQGGRTDSEFWRYLNTGATLTPFVEEVIGRAKYKLPSFAQYEHKWGTSTILWNWILAGLDMVNREGAVRQLEIYGKTLEGEERYLDLSVDSMNRNIRQDRFSLENYIHVLK
jgi:hypothetical protein